MATILTVDDDPDVLSLLDLFLRMHGHKVIQTRDGGEVIDLVIEHKPDLIITDIMMPSVTGGSVYQMVRTYVGPLMPVIVSSGTKMKVMGQQDDKFLVHCPKPIDQKNMLAIIDKMIAAAETAKKRN